MVEKYVEVNTLLNSMSDDLPYKGSVKRVLVQAKEANVRPVESAEWIWNKDAVDWGLGAWVCSVCGVKNDNIPRTLNFGKVQVNPYCWTGNKYCPNCGRKMVEKEKNYV
mgnify:CR=1 FL=1